MARIPLSTIKSSVQTILETANTTTGSPIDLSEGMASRVRQILQVNVEVMPEPQPSFYPCVTMFYESKQVTLQDMAGSMLTGRRRAEIDLKIVGIVWIDNMNTANFQYKDLADNECEQLMENIEQVLRSDPTLGGNALWSKTVDASYHNYPVSETAHMRAGIMTHRITVQY
jgi:hypothetical protein